MVGIAGVRMVRSRDERRTERQKGVMRRAVAVEEKGAGDWSVVAGTSSERALAMLRLEVGDDGLLV